MFRCIVAPTDAQKSDGAERRADEATAEDHFADVESTSQTGREARTDQSPAEATADEPGYGERVAPVGEIDTSAITGLRAITALQIACGHWLLFFGNNSNPYLDFQGGIAVSIFFLITGFVMQVAYCDKVEASDFRYWDFIKRRYFRMLPLHWFALAWYAPFIAFNYRTIVNDYNFWQNKSGEVNLIMGIALTPFLMQSWVFSLCYWNSVCWSLSCQLGYYFCFPWMARKVNALVAKLEQRASIDVPDDPENRSNNVNIFNVVQSSCRKYIWYAYHASYLAPLGLMGAMNSPAFRNMWRDVDMESRARVVVTALDNDLDGMRAYFCGRAWFPVRLPIFFMGMLLGAMRLRLARHGVKPHVERFWAKFTDYFSVAFSLWLIACIVSSGLVADSKNIRIFNEFFLTAPCAFWLYGLTVTRKSRTVKILRNGVMQAIGNWSFAMYLLQFPLFTSWAALEYDTMRVFPACDRSSPNVKVWADCFHNFESSSQHPNVVVIGFLFFLTITSFVAHHAIEKPGNKFIAKLFGARRRPAVETRP